MALDYQMKTYWPSRQDKRRTTYTLMNQWIHVKTFTDNSHLWEPEKNHTIPASPVRKTYGNFVDCDDRKSSTSKEIELGKLQRLTLDSRDSGALFVKPMDFVNKDADIQAQREAYNRRAKLKLRYINHPGKIALLGLTTRPALLEIKHSTDGQPHLQYYKSGGYDDFHKAFLAIDGKNSSPQTAVPPRFRQGRVGGSWRHIKEPIQPSGQRALFIDGVPKIDDMSRVMYRDGSGVNRIQKSVKIVRPLTAAPTVKTPDILKRRSVGSYHSPETVHGKEYGHWHIIR